MCVVFWAVDGGCWKVYERVHSEAGSEGIEVEDIEDLVLVHEGLGMGVDPFVSYLHSGGDAA